METYTFFSELLHFNSVALIFCAIPPKLTVMYFTNESYKTICLTKRNRHTQVFEFQIHQTLRKQTVEWSGKNKRVLISGVMW